MRAFLALLILGAPLAAERLTLADAEARAVQTHPRLAVARAQARVAAAAGPQVRSQLQPRIDGTITGSLAEHGSRMGVGGINAPDLFSRVGLGLGITQLVTDFGRTRLTAESLDTLARAREEGTRGVLAEVRLRVRTAYGRALAAGAAVTVARETLTARQGILRQAQALADSQLRSTLDAGFAEVRVAEAELLITRAENERRASLVELAQAMGAPAPGDWELVEPEADATLTDQEALLRDAVAARPEAAALRQQVTAARLQLAADRKLNLPVITASGVAGVVPTGDPRLRSRYLGAGLNLNVPLWNGHQFDYRREESAARVAQAESELAELELRVGGAVRLAWLEWETARNTVPVTQRLEQQATRTLRLAEERYRAGLGTVIEFNQAQLDLASARLATAAARYDVFVRESLVAFAAGRLAR